MSIKSKKWYENQIKANENALNNLHREATRLGSIYFNDLPSLFEANKPIKEKFNKVKSKLSDLKEEYYLYYK